MATEWAKRWGYWIASKPSKPGIYKLETGGFLVRARIKNPKTSKRETVIKPLHGASLAKAQAERDALISDKRESVSGKKPQRQLFGTFVASLFRTKVEANDIRSAKGKKKWEGLLRTQLIPEFGHLACDELGAWEAAQWRAKVAKMIAHGYTSSKRLRNGKTVERHVDLSPTTANTWISVFRSITASMTKTLNLPKDPGLAIDPFDTSQHETYTDEDPNALNATQLKDFLGATLRLFPQHYAMTLLGFATGKRPSSLRPLRVDGADSDVDWAEGFVRFRRSHTVGDEFMVGTKTGTKERVYLPPYVMEVLRQHRALLASPPLSDNGKEPLWWRKAMASSPLLFPGRNGKARSSSCLDKPFQLISREIGLPFDATPRAMRRTCNDIQRAAKVDAVVTRSITGHVTEEMRIHYSTAEAEEQRAAIAQVLDLVALAPPKQLAATSASEGAKKGASSTIAHENEAIRRAGEGIRTLDVHLGKVAGSSQVHETCVEIADGRCVDRADVGRNGVLSGCENGCDGRVGLALLAPAWPAELPRPIIVRGARVELVAGGAP